MIRLLLSLYSLLVLAHLVVTLIRIPSNKWTELLRSAVEPALEITRKLMERFLPMLCGKGFDWSPVVLIIVLNVLRAVLGWLV